MKLVKRPAVCNCKNRIMIEGHARNINQYVEKKEGCRDREVLTFTLININKNNEGDKFKSFIKVYLHRNKAVQVGLWLKDMGFVEVEGKLRIQDKDNVSIQAVYVCDASHDISDTKFEEEEVEEKIEEKTNEINQ